MKYALSIREHNQQAHLDIERDIQAKKDGLFTFILRVNAGNIVDYSLMEQVNGKRYGGIAKVLIQELTISYSNRKRG